MGSGPAPRRALAAAATALLAAAPLGCAGDGPKTPPASAGAPSAPQEVCTLLITHWAGVILNAGEGRDAVRLDYQSMGLSGGQNDILRAVLADARAEQGAAEGSAAAHRLIVREAQRRCADRYRSGAPTDGPWQ